MEQKINQSIDTGIWLDALNYTIQSNRENLCWLMHRVSIERSDDWRDQKFNEIRNLIDMRVAERETLLALIGEKNA